jgi:hypothetical protein
MQFCRRTTLTVATVLFVTGLTPALHGSAAHTDEPDLFIASAVEHPDGTVTLPLHRGTSHARLSTGAATVVSAHAGTSASGHRPKTRSCASCPYSLYW